MKLLMVVMIMIKIVAPEIIELAGATTKSDIWYVLLILLLLFN